MQNMETEIRNIRKVTTQVVDQVCLTFKIDNSLLLVLKHMSTLE